MGVSTHVIGYMEADAHFRKMKCIWDECVELRITIPNEVLEFFHNEYPGDEPCRKVDISGALEEWSDDYRSGFDVDITMLPKHVKIIRFYNSY